MLGSNSHTKISVSIVVPIYNAQRHLVLCIESLVSQTLENIEIILVDDGSTDNSPTILHSFARIHHNITHISLPKNLGRMMARKCGIDAAKGAYIGFVDSDDYVHPTMYETLYRAACSEDADIVSCGLINISPTGEEIARNVFKNDFDQIRDQRIMSDNPPTLWNNIFRRTLYDNKDLMYSNLSRGEDLLVVPCLFYYAKKTVMLQEALYYYKNASVASVSGGGIVLESQNIPSNLLKDLQGIRDLFVVADNLALFFKDKTTMAVDIIPLTTKFPDFFNRYNFKYVEKFFIDNNILQWYFTSLLQLILAYNVYYRGMFTHAKKENKGVLRTFHKVFGIDSLVHTFNGRVVRREELATEEIDANIQRFLNILKFKHKVRDIARHIYRTLSFFQINGTNK